MKGIVKYPPPSPGYRIYVLELQSAEGDAVIDVSQMTTYYVLRVRHRSPAAVVQHTTTLGTWDKVMGKIVHDFSPSEWEVTYESTPYLHAWLLEQETKATTALSELEDHYKPKDEAMADLPKSQCLMFELENTCGSSRKFWRVELRAGANAWFARYSWGRIGTAGQHKETAHLYLGTVIADIRSKVCDKRNHGYVWKTRLVAHEFAAAHLSGWSEMGVQIDEPATQLGSAPANVVGALTPAYAPPAPAPAVVVSPPTPGLRKLVLPKKP